MKKLILSTKILFISSLIIFSGCKDTLDINTDPNNPGLENATPEVLFPSAVMSSAGMIGGQLAVLGGIWAQYYTQSSNSSQFREIDAYNLTSNSEVVNLPYDELFSGALNDYDLAITKAKEIGDWRYNLMGTVMKAYTYQVLADLYDQVPYTEALKGQANIQPKFDDGYSIYVSLLAQIDSALAQDYLSSEFSQSQKNTDFVFGGNMGSWTKFANTLKLKMYLRMVNAKPAEAEAGIRALYSSGAQFLDIPAQVNVFTNVPNKSNPFYEFVIRRLNTTTNLRASYTFTSWLRTNGDPRIVPYFINESSDPNPVIAMHQGDYGATSTQEPTYGNANTFVINADDPVDFISEAESYFMQAESLERYFGGSSNGVTAQQMYNAGVTAAFSQVGLTPGALLTTSYAYPAGGSLEQKLEAIIVQKWASFPGSHALEGFFEQSRTGYPRVSAVYSKDPSYIPGQWVYSKNGITGGSFPKRLVFPGDERSRNTNTPAEVPITTKVWWAK